MKITLKEFQIHFSVPSSCISFSCVPILSIEGTSKIPLVLVYKYSIYPRVTLRPLFSATDVNSFSCCETSRCFAYPRAFTREHARSSRFTIVVFFILLCSRKVWQSNVYGKMCLLSQSQPNIRDLLCIRDRQKQTTRLNQAHSRVLYSLFSVCFLPGQNLISVGAELKDLALA